jgi:hypothetical protein
MRSIGVRASPGAVYNTNNIVLVYINTPVMKVSTRSPPRRKNNPAMSIPEFHIYNTKIPTKIRGVALLVSINDFLEVI